MVRGRELTAFFRRSGYIVEKRGVDQENPGYVLRVLEAQNGTTRQVVTYYIDADDLIAPFAIYHELPHLPEPLQFELSDFVEKLYFVPGFFDQWSAQHDP